MNHQDVTSILGIPQDFAGIPNGFRVSTRMMAGNADTESWVQSLREHKEYLGGWSLGFLGILGLVVWDGVTDGGKKSETNLEPKNWHRRDYSKKLMEVWKGTWW